MIDLKDFKKQMKESVDGKVMIRKDNRYKGLEQRGILSYDVYFDYPTNDNKETIKRVITEHGYEALGFRIIGGSYGYVISFRIDTKKGETKQ